MKNSALTVFEIPGLGAIMTSESYTAFGTFRNETETVTAVPVTLERINHARRKLIRRDAEAQTARCEV